MVVPRRRLAEPADVGNLDFDRRTLGLLAAVLAVSVALTLFFTRQSAQPQTAGLVPVASVTAAPPPAVPGGSPSAPPSAQAEVVVEVVGKVRSPAVVSLPKGSRVQDALEAVGGPRPGTDTTDQNLARLLVDGEQIRIGLGDSPDPVGAPATTGTDPDASAGAPVNINTAGVTQLEQIPGVGPVLAQRIVTYREQNGGFTSVEQLTEVSGIGEVTFAQMQPMVTVGGGG